MRFKLIRRIVNDDRAATAIEYAVTAAFISVACIGGMQAIGGQSDRGWKGVWAKTQAVLGY